MSPASHILLGPPGLRRESPPTAGDSGVHIPVETIVEKTISLDLSEDEDSFSTAVEVTGEPLMGLTENLAPTFLSTGNPCLDFFFHVVPDTPPQDLIGRLQLAWDHNPLTTLKLICNLRGVRGTGKSDKEGFYTASLWLYQNHPKTLAANVRAIADFGYFKDLLEILYRILEGPDVRKLEKEKANKSEPISKFPRNFGGRKRGKFKRQNRPKDENGEKIVKIRKNLEELKELQVKEKETARVLRKEKEAIKAKRALEKYNLDPNYRLLHDQISDLFADLLKSDIENLNSGNCRKISLAAKWCPTIDSSYDKSTLICESIARKLFPIESYQEFAGLEESHYVYRVRDRLRKSVLVPLHKALELPEVFMSANQWNSLPYNRVPSVAMKNYKELFIKHDEDRFKEFLEDVKSGKAKIAAGALLPHEIIGALGDGDGGEVAELQWNRMVDDLKKKGKLSNCIAVCDVSGSMSGIPMEVSVALGILVSEISEEPWKGKLITFSANPELQKVEGDTLLEKTKFVREMAWGMNTDFQKVFDQILKVAVEGNLSDEQMIKRVFVFSDMEFDQARTVYQDTDTDTDNESQGRGTDNESQGRGTDNESGVMDFDKQPLPLSNNESGGMKSDNESENRDTDNESGDMDFDKPPLPLLNNESGDMKSDEPSLNPWETDYEAIKRKFGERGYKNVPEIVFWNLRDSSSTPVVARQSGVALVSGFSKNLLTIFLEGGGIVNPEDVMELAISGEEYKKLMLCD